ncbi:MAG: hypothetical protein KKB82_09150 [Candidatus Omnitrophica bacterium]|nr:hypothetical protein [Candidatus Omnitrophota bacterium]MBU1926070.1 hypothetical protein [Candidatus Omnitrophota bacterium]
MKMRRTRQTNTFFRITALALIWAFLLGDISLAGSMVMTFKAQKEERNVLSPQIIIHTPLLQKAYLEYRKSILPLNWTEESNSLPEWLNIEGLAQIKDLRIEKKVLPAQVSVTREHDIFDGISFHITSKDESGRQQEVGFIKIWVYRDPQGARLFSDKEDNFNIQVVTFYPKLPKSKGSRRNGEVLKAGLGISLLWLLLAQELDWQGKKGVIYNASKSSNIAFGKLKQKWPSIDEFTARPFFGKTVNIPPMRNIKFDAPVLTSGQKKEVKDFLENKISFVDEQGEKISVFPELGKGVAREKKMDEDFDADSIVRQTINALIEGRISRAERLFGSLQEHNIPEFSLEPSRVEEINRKTWQHVKEKAGTVEDIREMSPEEFARKIGVFILPIEVEMFVLDRATAKLVKKMREFYGGKDKLWQDIKKPNSLISDYPDIIRIFHPAIEEAGIYYSPAYYQGKQGWDTINKTAFFHELLEKNFFENGIIDPVFCSLFDHANSRVIEEELKFSEMIGEFPKMIKCRVGNFWKAKQDILVEVLAKQVHNLISPREILEVWRSIQELETIVNSHVDRLDLGLEPEWAAFTKEMFLKIENGVLQQKFLGLVNGQLNNQVVEQAI